MITITEKEYDSLIENSMRLESLENAGVDNWVGYDFAREIYQEIKAEAEALDKVK